MNTLDQMHTYFDLSKKFHQGRKRSAAYRATMRATDEGRNKVLHTLDVKPVRAR